MRFCVSVPVLSTHSTVAWPRVSIVLRRRVSTCKAAKRRAAKAGNNNKMTGNSSGNTAMAKVMPANTAPKALPRCHQKTSASATHSDNPISAKRWVRRLISSCRGDAAGAMVCSEWPMAPICVFRPVAVTCITPWPRTTSVPANTAAPGVSLFTGTDSPVSSDSSMASSCACNSTPSAGTRPPSLSKSTSPRTTSRPANCTVWPPRTAVAWGLDKSRSASKALSVRRSCNTVVSMMINTKPIKTRASRVSPSAR